MEDRRQKTEVRLPASVFCPQSSDLQYSLFAVLLCVTTASGQSSTNQPQIRYLYPSGGQQDTVIQITAGGLGIRW